MSEKLTAARGAKRPVAAATDPNPVQANVFAWSDRFVQRHIGPNAAEVNEMLRTCGFNALDSLIDAAIPSQIRLKRPLNLPPSRSEHGLLNELKTMAAKNRVFRSFIGTGYSDCITPPVIQRNILENPGWYTQYTPYQAEIAQGRPCGTWITSYRWDAGDPCVSGHWYACVALGPEVRDGGASRDSSRSP